jgi:hypothetical protein
MTRVARRWLEAQQRPQSPLPVALVASLRPGATLLTQSGERAVVEVASAREVWVRMGTLTMRLQSTLRDYSWAEDLAPLVVWLFD